MVAIKRGVEIEEQVRALMAEARDDRDASGGGVARDESAPQRRSVPRSRRAAPRARPDQHQGPHRPRRWESAHFPHPPHECVPLLVRLLPHASGARPAAARARARQSCAPLHDRLSPGLVRRPLRDERHPEGPGLRDGEDAPARRDPSASRTGTAGIFTRRPSPAPSRGRSNASCASWTASPTTSKRRASARSTSTLPARASRAALRCSRRRGTRRSRCARPGVRPRARPPRLFRLLSPLARCRGVAAPPFEPGGMRAGATTQFVVGLGKESDRELLSFAEGLEKKRLIHHPQFAAFRPIRNTPLENVPGTPPLRERRLYQADHLMREYGFSAEELVYGKDGHLPLDHDPKLTWALANPGRFPVELTTASREELRRVPGFGPRAVERILETRARESSEGSRRSQAARRSGRPGRGFRHLARTPDRHSLHPDASLRKCLLWRCLRVQPGHVSMKRPACHEPKVVNAYARIADCVWSRPHRLPR